MLCQNIDLQTPSKCLLSLCVRRDVVTGVVDDMSVIDLDIEEREERAEWTKQPQYASDAISGFRLPPHGE